MKGSKEVVKMMHSGEMCDALLNGGIGETVKLSGKREDLLSAMRKLKAHKIPLKGAIEICTDYKGTNIRKIDFLNSNAVFALFGKFTNPTKDIVARPYLDEKGNGIIGTDGWGMLVSRIPDNFPRDKAASSGFCTDVRIRWQEIADEIEPTEYALSHYRRMATVSKGEELHGFLQTAADAVKAYAHSDDEGYLNTLYVRIGQKFYDARRLSGLVDALFKLGCRKVAICEYLTFGNHIRKSSPISLFGIGGTVAAKGILMPIKYADESTGAFVLPIDKTAERNVA